MPVKIHEVADVETLFQAQCGKLGASSNGHFSIHRSEYFMSSVVIVINISPPTKVTANQAHCGM